MPGAVADIRALFEQKVLTRTRNLELEPPVRRLFPYPLLYGFQLDIQNATEFAPSERLENHDLVQSVDELRRELPPCRPRHGTAHLCANPLVYRAGHSLSPKLSRFESHPRL